MTKIAESIHQIVPCQCTDCNTSSIFQDCWTETTEMTSSDDDIDPELKEGIKNIM